MAERAESMGGGIEEFDREDEDGPVETDEGGAIYTIGDDEQSESIQEEQDFYANLVPDIEVGLLDTLASRLIEDIDRDKKAREQRDKDYAEAIRRTGLGKEAPGGADFDGASRVTHPVLSESAIDFAAQAIREILPSNGPVKMFVPGEDIDPKRLERATRKKNYMNWQLTTQMPEFRTEIDQMLPQVALSGSQFLRLTPDTTKGKKMRPVPQYIPSDLLSYPYSASSFYSAERQTYHEPVTRTEFLNRVATKFYHYESQIVNPQRPAPTDPQHASQKVEGKSESDYYNADGVRTVHECSTWLDIGDTAIDVADGQEGDREVESEIGMAPYIVSIDESTRKIVRIVRNWEQEDENMERMQWIVEFPMILWRGSGSIGLNHLIGGLAASATGSLRALLDTAHVNNIPTLLKLKNANFMGQSKQVSATGIVEIDGGATGANDIRQLVMQVPFNEPSVVLYQLLGFCVDAAKGVVRTTFDDLSEDNKNLPVGTTLALIEQGMKVTSAIHMRLYHAMTYVIRILHRINKMYLTDEEIRDDTGVVLAYAADFDGPVDCIPTADPEIFSDVQRMAQWQAVMARADMRPDLYNGREVEKRFLQRTKIPDAEGLLIPEQKPEQMNPVNENAAMSLGRPVGAFPEQDHLAHLQAHLDFLLSPVLGQLPVIAPVYVPAVMNHIREHVVLWYVSEFYARTGEEMLMEMGGEDADETMSLVMKHREAKVRKELERLLAVESPDIVASAAKIFEQLPQITSQGMEMARQFNQPPQMPVDPNKMAETNRKTQEMQLKIQQKDKEITIDSELQLRKLSSEERREAIRQAQEDQRAAEDRITRLLELDEQERSEDERLAVEVESRERINTQDNLTAITIARGELAHDKKSQRSTGTGTDQNPQPK